MKNSRRISVGCLAALFAIAPWAIAQSASNEPSRQNYPEVNTEQIANILGISDIVHSAKTLRAQAPCHAAPTIDELAMRQEILERVTVSSLEVDGVLAELNNEQARLSELSSALQSRRDHSLNLVNVANLVTGTGVGIGVNALQFSSSTANIGNSLGVGSGVASTVLSIIGIRRQRGPLAAVGRVPNMLAPLFRRDAKLNSYYPPIVLTYLHSAPAGQSKDSGSRLDRLMTQWSQTGRTEPAGSSKSIKKITKLTSSSDDKVALSIDDISDRTAMLSDVAGEVALTKRDLAGLMVSIRAASKCDIR
jgi:hypothetical protein